MRGGSEESPPSLNSPPKCKQEVQLGEPLTCVVNAAFILLWWSKMEVVQKEPWYFMLLIFFSALRGHSEARETAVVHLEEGMVLGCLCPWDGNLTMVIWSKESKTMAVFHPELGAVMMDKYNERVTFLKTSDMDGSISLRNVTHQDIGLYKCSIQTFPNGPWTKTFEVEDLDDPPEIDDEDDEEEGEEQATEWPGAEETRLNLGIEAELGSNLTLDCDQKLNLSVSQVIMERRLSGRWKIIGVCKSVDDQIVTEDYSDRGRILCDEDLVLTLHLSGVAGEDGGFYRCVSSTDAGVQNTTVHVTVTTTGGFSLNLCWMYVFIGMGAAGLVLLHVVIILTIRHRKKNRRIEYRVKEHPFHKQQHFYENVLTLDAAPKRSRQMKKYPIYANVYSVRVQAP